MEFSFENELKQTELILKESFLTKVVGLAIIISIFIYAVVAYLYKPRFPLPTKQVQDLWGVFNVVAIFLIVLVLGIRRTIYFSPRLIKEEFNLQALLQRWRIIDIVLMAGGETIAILGLVITLLGMPFARTFHFFVSSALVILILMPFTFKVKDKIRIFARNAGKFPEI